MSTRKQLEGAPVMCRAATLCSKRFNLTAADLETELIKAYRLCKHLGKVCCLQISLSLFPRAVSCPAIAAQQYAPKSLFLFAMMVSALVIP
jgi:hypothetical protein